MDPSLLLALLSLPLKPFIWIGRMLGIRTDPHIVFGATLSANAQDKRQSYRHLYNVECVNKRRSGWLGKRFPPNDAHDCRAELQFQLTSSDSPVNKAEAIITPGPISGTVMTLFTDKPAAIPVYWEADGTIPRPNRPDTELYPAGYYVAGAEFLIHGEVARDWRLTPGDYVVTVRVTWDRKPFETKFELTVPSSSI